MDGGDIPEEVEADLTARVSGTYAVRVTDNNGCVGSSAEMVVTINDNPLPEIQGSPQGCVSSGAALWTQAAASYLWFKDGEAIPGATSPDITALESGSYSVQVTNSNGCTGTSQDFAVTISPDPTPTVTGLSAGCPSVEISTETHLAYQWQKDGMDIPGATEQTYEAIESGSYAVHVTDAFDCSGTSGPFTVHICACSLACTASASPTVGRTALTFSFSATVTSTNCAGTESYAWTFGDGETSTDQSPNHTYASAGTYTWTLTVTVGGVTCGKTGIVTVEPGLPGDGNGDGVVSIGEVQQAINMFLGTQAPGNGVDCNGDGTVSIGEVQKVVNAFLGLSSSC
jgi:PKD repeat protein